MSLRGRAAVLGCLVVVTALGGGVGFAALTRSTAETPTPPAQRSGCADVRSTRGRETTIRGSDRKETICGTQGKDLIYPEGGNDTVWGKGGDDKIWAKNRRPDLVSGGEGKDWAEVDSCDTTGGIEKVVRARNRCRGVTSTGPNALAKKAIDYYSLAYQATVECHSRGFATDGFQMRISEEPTILAVNTTGRPDWQFVTWIPLLYKWNGTEWQQIVVNNAFWLWDWTIDSQDTEFLAVRNFWRALGGRRIRTGFNHLDPSSAYQIRIQARWYKTKRTATGSIEFVAGQHFGVYESSSAHDSCTFPAAPPPAANGGFTLSRAGSPGQFRAG